ncbi:Uncharacterised protein [Neisseria gonorrhoeae]|uniref:Uncharacterized protein n=1 Tax=Neisseria gonorrhoeae TaxID=485 RepID=A0A378VVR2_NEIGO|nr:Uncharacterised protein [Neisseria gonorrhoeae]
MPSENRFGFRRHFFVCGNHGSNIELRRNAFAFHPSAAGGGFAFAHQFDEDVARLVIRAFGICTCNRRRVSGCMVVSLSWSGFISPKPLKRLME